MAITRTLSQKSPQINNLINDHLDPIHLGVGLCSPNALVVIIYIHLYSSKKHNNSAENRTT